MKKTLKDYTNQQFGRLTFIKKSGNRNKEGKIIWELLCTCGATIFRPPYAVIGGRIKSCGCLTKETGKANGSRNGQSKRKHLPHISSAMDLYRGSYDDGCDFDTFLKLSQKPCHYCSRLPHRTYNTANRGQRKVSQLQRDLGDFTYNGLDRIDNSMNHSPSNVVPCCYDCNRAKCTMSYNDFIAHIKRMYLTFFPISED